MQFTAIMAKKTQNNKQQKKNPKKTKKIPLEWRKSADVLKARKYSDDSLSFLSIFNFCYNSNLLIFPEQTIFPLLQSLWTTFQLTEKTFEKFSRSVVYPPSLQYWQETSMQ